MQHIEDGTLKLPALPLALKGARVLTEGSATVVSDGKTLLVALDETARRPSPVTVIELELDGDVMALALIETTGERETLAVNAVVAASSQRFDNTPPNAPILIPEIEENQGDYRKLWVLKNKGKEIPEELQGLTVYDFIMRARGFRTRYWMAADDKQPWLEVDLGEPKTISEVHLLEKFCRIRAFEMQYEKGGKWISFYKGGRMNFFDVKLAEPITAQKVRVVITERTKEGPPGIKIFDLF